MVGRFTKDGFGGQVGSSYRPAEFRSLRWRAAAVAFAALVAAAPGCSSGGGGAPTVVQPAPTPTPAPAPTPTPTPAPPTVIPPSGAEFQQNAGAFNQIGLLPAITAGVFGDGALVAVIDTGYDFGSIEYAGRINANSADLLIPSVVGSGDARVGGPDIDDKDGHGNAIAAIIGAARNGVGMHGIAPEAELLIFRADDDSADDLSILGAAIREGMQRSANLGADVINLSLGSDEAAARTSFRSFFSISSAGDVVTVIAAGNEGAARPEQSALAALDPQANGTVLIAGAVTLGDVISDFSNLAGEARNFYITAPGELIRVPRQNTTAGSLEFFSGTSASTPIIAGAAALVRSVWPSLSARAVVDILRSTATDLGATGVDDIYGAGRLDIDAALRPSGALSTASATGSSIDLSASPVDVSAAFGVASGAGATLTFLDRFGRDFTAPVDATGGWRATGAASLEGALGFGVASVSRTVRAGEAKIRLRFDDRDAAMRDPAAALMSPSADAFGETAGQGRFADHSLRFAASQPVGPDAAFMFAQGFTPGEIDEAGRIAPFAGGQGRLSLSAEGFDDPYLASARADVATAFSLDLGGVTFSALASVADAAAAGIADPFVPAPDAVRRRTNNMRVGIAFGSAGDRFSLDAGLRSEEGAVLDARFGGAVGSIDESLTAYQSARADVGLAGSWRAFAMGTVGVSDVGLAGDGLATRFDRLVSTQFALSLYRRNLLIDGDAIALTVRQPLWVEAGGVDLLSPVAYDPYAGEFTFAAQRVGFGDAPRRVDLEGAWRLYGLRGASLEAGVLYQMNARPAVSGGAADALAALVRIQTGF